MHESPEMQAAWTAYWKQGATESLPIAQAAGRLAELDEAWREFFAAFPQSARLLDLATGGGDLIRRMVAAGHEFNITGVDFADLSAVSAGLQNSRTRLVGNTDLSTLPFADASFDGVTSQFGIEYADMPAATCEAVRVLVPSGRGLFVLHHAGGIITQVVTARLAAYESVFAGTNAFEAGRTVFELYRRSAAQGEITQAEAVFRNAVNILQARLGSEPRFETARMVVAFLAGLARTPALPSADEALRRIDGAEAQAKANALRNSAQISAALDANGVKRLANTLSEAGAFVEPPRELKTVLGKPMAWSLSFRR